MKLKTSLIAGAALAVCSISSYAAGGLNTAACTAAIVDGTTAAALVNNCEPAATLFVGGASTMSGSIATILNTAIFDTTKMTPIVVSEPSPAVTPAGLNGNVKYYVGIAQAGLPTVGGKLVFAIYNYNNGSAQGASQLLSAVPKLSANTGPMAIPEADVLFVGPAKDANTPGGTTPNTCTGTSATAVTCSSHTTQQLALALMDVRAEELYAIYPAAAKGKLSSLTEVPLFLESFAVGVSDPLYKALQEKNFGAGSACIGDFATPACQPSISRTDYSSLVMSGGSIKQLGDLVGASNQTVASDGLSDHVLHVARRDDLSGTQAASNIYFVGGQCEGNDRNSATLLGQPNAYFNAKSIDAAVMKAGGLLGGLAIRTHGDAESASLMGLDIQANPAGGQVKTALSSTTSYAIGVLGTGGGGAIASGHGRLIKVDGMSPNFDGTNFANAAATRNQLASGAYNFGTVMHAAYVPANLAKDKTGQSGMVQAIISAFQNSNNSNVSGVAYLDGTTTGVVAQQSKVTRTDSNGKANNCSPMHRL
ncbi:MAG: hypothetical protein JO006_19135 [Paucibacter sp.]|nr:hypothetical protein [Roseateles sp.]